MRPAIWLGRPLGSLMRLSAIHSLAPVLAWVPARWSNFTVVFLPTLKVSQFRMALSAVCSMVTVVLPFAADCTGSLALSQPAVSEFVSTFRPPSVRPSGAESPLASASARFCVCCACCAAIARAARFRLVMDVCSCWLAADDGCVGWTRLDAGAPFGSLPVAIAPACAAPLSANHAGLNARWACALPRTPPAASATAMARARGAILKTCCAARAGRFFSLHPLMVMSRSRRSKACAEGAARVAQANPIQEAPAMAIESQGDRSRQFLDGTETSNSRRIFLASLWARACRCGLGPESPCRSTARARCTSAKSRKLHSGCARQPWKAATSRQGHHPTPGVQR
ncbi:hypothetical protein D9M72_197680 [compost metagenome]